VSDHLGGALPVPAEAPRDVTSISRETQIEQHAAASTPSMLEVQDLRIAFGGLRALEGTSFKVPQATLCGLIGPNGAGKSTVLNIVGGQMPPDSGRVLFRGEEIQGKPSHRIARRGLVRTFQTANVFSRLTVLENLLVGAPPWRGETFHAALAGRRYWRRREAALIQRAGDVMDRFGMTSLRDEYAGTLSGGQKRILEIMRALMSDPAMLLLDEPMAGVNPTLAHSIGERLRELKGTGITMLMIEHDLALVERLCDSVVVMARGRVLAEGSLRDLRNRREVVDAYLAG
jgi:ABC-type branched-subunit amino acid transport system ATPase component